MAKKISWAKRKHNGHANRVLTTKRITHAAHDAREKMVEVEKSVQKYAKAHPWKTMGISVLAGVVVARILGTRR